MTQLILKPGRERSVLKHHPWLFEGAVERLVGRAHSGDTVDVLGADGRALGRAAWSPNSRIRARMWSFNPAEIIDDAFFKRRVAAALARRTDLPELTGQQGLRLIHAESDGLPGVICDRYGDTLVLAFTSAGAEKWRGAITAAALKQTGCSRCYERSDADLRSLEGLDPRCGWLSGDAADEPLVIDEHGIRMEVDVVAGHKTGFYLDQRENRRRVETLAAGRDVLNAFSFSGGFSLYAARGGARSTTDLDISPHALESARRNFALNSADPQIAACRHECAQADTFDWLAASSRADFDLVILDPPSLAKRETERTGAIQAYRKLTALGLPRLRRDGILVAASCSAHVSAPEFFDAVLDALQSSRRPFAELARTTHAPDHPATFPEAQYLKCLFVRLEP